MSTPMFDEPFHVAIGVNFDGNGPVDRNHPDYAGEVCCCGGLMWPCPDDEERE